MSDYHPDESFALELDRTDPLAEYRECINKAEAVLAAVQAAQNV